MKKFVLPTLIGILIATSAYSQDKQKLARSDSLYALGVELYNAGEYYEAIPFFDRSSRIDRAELDITSNRRDYSAMWLANCYYKIGNEYLAKNTDEEHYMIEPIDRRLTIASDSLATIGETYYMDGDYEKALEYFLQCAELEKNVLGKDSYWYGSTVSDIARCFFCVGNYEEAIRLGTEALDITERVLGKKHPDYATVLSNLAEFNFALDNYEEAIRLGTEALEIYEKTYGKEHLNYASSLNNLANYNSYIGNYAEALSLSTGALEIRERVLGKENIDYATSLSNIAIHNSNLGNYEEAIRLGTEALGLIEKFWGKENSNYATSLGNVAKYNSYIGNYAEALSLSTGALEIRERVLGKEHRDYATSLSQIAECNYDLGNYEEAVRLGTEALKIRERVLGKEHSDYASSLNNLANYNSELGKYAEAIRLETEALEIVERLYGKEHLDYVASLNNLAKYDSQLGNYEEAIRLGTEALEIVERLYGKERSDYASLLSNLANYNSYLGNYTEAIRLGTEALKIRGLVLGKEHPDCATSLYNLATYNSELGKYAEAIRLGTEALEIYEKILGKEHPYYVAALDLIANYNSELGDYEEALSLSTEALKIRGRVLGKEHPDYALPLTNIARYNAYLGNYSEVSNCVIESTYLQSQFVLNTFSNLTTNERTLFWNKYKDWFEGGLPQYTYYLQTDSLIATTYDGALLSKGLLLNAEIEMNKLLQESGDTVFSKYQRLQTNKAMINKLQERFATQYNTNDTLILRNNIDSLSNVVRLQERELVQLSKTYGDYTKNLSINWHDVQEKLGKDDVAIEFLSFPVKNDSIMYVALTLTKDDDVPHMTSLFEKKELDKVDNSAYYKTTDVSQLVWKPLSDVMEGKENVYFAPAGELHNIAIESIPYYDGEGLMSDPEHWNMYRLSSTRNLALIKDKYDIKSADVYGGLKYDMTKVAIEESGENSSTGEVQYEVRAIADSLSLRGGIEIPPRTLPATKIEAENVEKILVTMDVDSKLYTDTLGTETSFKALSGNKTNLLHIATHGFYWTDTEAKNMGDLSFLAPLNYDTSPRYVEDKALTRTGLIFAGASYALEGNPLPEGVNDGILTAREISILDLRGLDLVVLSACQTGLGEITGDGVFGLQRGFKKAGANTIMMSLWEVNDEATQLLVSEFYNNLAQGKSKYDALREAQQFVRDYEIEETITTNDNLTAHQRRQLERERKSLEVQTTICKKKPYASPKFWAGFILLDAID